MFGGIDNFSLLAIPFFILAGELMETGGISQRLVTLARVLVGHIRGGLGNVVLIAMIFFSGISGSTNADAAAIGSVMIPPDEAPGLQRRSCRCDRGRRRGNGHSGATVPDDGRLRKHHQHLDRHVVRGGLPAGLYHDGGTDDSSAHRREAAGSDAGPACPLARAPEGALRGLLGAAPAGHHIRRHLGGVFTPTEAAVVAVVYAIIVGMAVYREISFAFLLRAFVRTGVTSGIVMLLIGGANIFAWLMTVSGVPAAIAGAIQSMGGGKAVFLSMSIVVFLPLFALLDGLPGMLMIMPVFVPIAQQLGIDLIHYGILMTTVMGVALFLPPFGVGLYIVLGLSGATIGETSRHLLPYLATMTAVTVVIAFVPWIVFLIPYVFNLYTPL